MAAAYPDTLARILSDIWRSEKDARQRAADELREFVTEVSRELAGELFTKFMNDLNKSIFELVNSSDNSHKIAGVIAIDAIIEVEGEEDAVKVTRFANYLRHVLPATDPYVMEMGARVLGRLSVPGVGGSMTSDFVVFEVNRALESLQSDRHENKRLSAVLVLEALGSNAPALVHSHLRKIMDVMWVALRDPKATVREAASKALRVCLDIIKQREHLTSFQWYLALYDEAKRGLHSANSDHVHASLLCLRELLDRTRAFVEDEDRYTEICKAVIRLRDHKDPLIRRTVMSIIPSLATFDPVEFKQFLGHCMSYLTSQLRKEREAAFSAIGQVALVMRSNVGNFLDEIVKIMQDLLSPRQRTRIGSDPPILSCISMLARAVGVTLARYIHHYKILELIFLGGLNEPLIGALEDLATFIPALLPEIQDRLLRLLSMTLSGKLYRPPGAPVRASPRVPVPLCDPAALESKNTETTILALRTLGTFDFTGHFLNEFVREVVMVHLEVDIPAIRKSSAVTCCSLLARDPVRHQSSGQSIQIVNDILEKLLSVAIADPEPDIRQTVLASLTEAFDSHLAHAQNIRSLFMALNDEVFQNRILAVRIVGRLSKYNPAYVMPGLRKKLIQLMTELEFTSVPTATEECARLLGELVSSAGRLIKPYVEPVVKVLLPKTKHSCPTVASTALDAIGELAMVSGEDLGSYFDELIPLILDTIKDQSSLVKREAALKTFTKLAGSAGYVIEPYFKYPNLLGLLTSMLRSEQQSASITRETLKLLGTLGALDPYRQRLGARYGEPHAVETVPFAASVESDVDSSSIKVIGPSSPDYNPTVVISALMKILKDPSLSSHHTAVVQALLYIVGTLGSKSFPFLPQVLPAFLAMMKTCPSGMLDFYFGQLAVLIGIVKQYIRTYLPDILALIELYSQPLWNLQITIVSLLEAVARALNGEFKIHIPTLLPYLLDILEKDGTSRRLATQRALNALIVFGPALEGYLHLVMPKVVEIIGNKDVPMAVRKTAIQTVGSLCKEVNVSDHVSRIIHPLARALAVPASDIRMAVMDTLCAIVLQLGPEYAIFIPMVNKELLRHRVQHPSYELLVAKVLNNETPPYDIAGDPESRFPDQKGEDTAAVVDSGAVPKLPVNQQHLKRAWEVSQRTTKEDWHDWIRHFAVELLKESPSPSLRACASLAAVHPGLARELFNASFVSCWTELYDQFQDELVRALESALTSPNIPPEILQALLNLAEFMEHDDKPLPIDIRTLGAHATKCHAHAKALHYKELEFISEASMKWVDSSQTIESLISINNKLQQPDAAIGILTFAQKNHKVSLKETWYEKLQRWDDALEAYRQKRTSEPDSFDIILGQMRCLHALGNWDKLSMMVDSCWDKSDDLQKETMSSFAAAAAWGIGEWHSMQKYVSAMKADTGEKPYFKAILAVHCNRHAEAQVHIDDARKLLDTELAALAGESYSRAYDIVVRIQMLCELEEIIIYKGCADQPSRRISMQRTWMKRLQGAQRNVEVWQRVLKVRSLVLPPQDDVETMIKFANLCRKNGRFGLTLKTLNKLLVRPITEAEESSIVLQSQPAVSYSYLKYMWEVGRKVEAKDLLHTFTDTLAASMGISSPGEGFFPDPAVMIDEDVTDNTRLLARCYHKLGSWQTILDGSWIDGNVTGILRAHLLATHYDRLWYKAWHSWALSNFEVVTQYERDIEKLPPRVLVGHIVPSVQGFFRSIALSRGSSLQDALRLLTLWFKYGDHEDVAMAISEGFATVAIDTWLQVVPQLIARIHTQSPQIRRLTHQLLADVGKEHPQALIYPLTVASKSQNEARRAGASAIMDKMRNHSPLLVEQALLVSQELIRVAILWHEMWFEALEEASKLYFGDKNVQGMFQTLEPLHAMLEKGPETLREISFNQAYGRDLREALEWCKKYKKTHDRDDLNQAWDLYFQVFRRINKQLPQLTTLELQYVSPKLLNARDLQLAVPGSYRPGQQLIKITGFSPVLSVITSKQRPRKLTIAGSDGKDYQYLLKGHEDLRQDERVMQFFGLVNNLLAQDTETFKRHLSIHRYPSIPLFLNSGLLGWVPHTDTLNSLIRDYRENRKILLNIEHRLMLQMAPDYDSLTLIQKMEVFEYALESTTGSDLYKVLWLKSKNSEAWLDRRTNYTRSLALMSMVGYVLGLGDRHPSNLMLDRFTGKVVHIDFGDCFEVAMQREKYPEQVPFRLTRMLVNAMEVSGIEGSFRITCNNVMRVLRGNKDSLMAVLEAFVYDPLVNWRLMAPAGNARGGAGAQDRDKAKYGGVNRTDDSSENWRKTEMNTRALKVIERVKGKLEGKDFNPEKELSVEKQVEKLIERATDLELLCQCYIGWCAFW